MELEHTSNLLYLRQGQQLPCVEKEEHTEFKEGAEEKSFENVLLRKEKSDEELKDLAVLMNSREFEEEVANLLLEFRHQDPALSPKRKSPPSSPLFESFSTQAKESFKDEKVESTSPLLKRRRTTKAAVKDDDFEEKAFLFKSRKTYDIHDSEPEAMEDEEEEYEEEVVIDEEYLDDDDDWYEANRNHSPANFSSGLGLSNSGRLARKKAPSGSACDKHKRWKKRCPDDCPMRSASKQPRRRKSPKQSPAFNDEFRESFEDFQTSPRDDYGHGIEEDLQLGNSMLSAIENQSIIQNLYAFVAERKTSSRPSKSDYLSLVRWSLEQLAKEETCTLSPTDMTSLETALLNKITSEAVFQPEMSGRARKTRPVSDDSSITVGPSGKKQTLTSLACEKHTSLHARCPSNCPERREAQVLIRGRRKPQSDIYSELAEEVSLSAYSVIQQTESLLDQDIATSPRVKRDNPKSKAKASSKGRSGRKYLPSACDRHKILHAKCPANCPDRLKRDAESSKNRTASLVA